MKTSPEFDVKQIMNIFYVQKKILIAVFLVVFALAAYLAMSLPDIYRSRTMLLISPPKLPSSYVASPVTTTIEQRLRRISDDILSRTRLEKIVQEFDLYSQVGSMDARVDKLRKNIVLDIRRSDAFLLSFDHRIPEKAMQVTAGLGAFFVSENQQMREQQAVGTTTFINAEAERLRKALEEQEATVNLYKAQHRSELPEQLDANLRTLDQLRRELEAGTLRLSSLQERRANLAKQMAELDLLGSEVGMISGVGGAQNILVSTGIDGRKRELDGLLRKYSAKHPDVVRLKREIEILEAETPALESGESVPNGKGSTGPSLKDTLASQIGDLKLEIDSLRSKNEVLRSQIASYQVRVDNTPLRAIELSKISRAYEITVKKYQDLQGKSLESQISENMEKTDRAERFQVLDPANLPQVPVGPNRLRILIAGLALALVSGLGVAFLQENLDSSFKRADDLRQNTSVPVLAVIPATSTRGSMLEQRRAQGMLVLASVMVLIVGAVSIHIYGAMLY
jgi:polysaccharide chain length determinant protein (PEP-CTERM system associated)